MRGDEGRATMTRAILVDPTDPRWAGALERLRHDFYYLPPYVALEAGRLGGEAVACVAEDPQGIALLPLVLRPVVVAGERLGAPLDASSPYGYCGPLFSEGTDATWRARTVLAMMQALRDRGVISLFLRLHPLFSSQRDALVGEGTLLDHGESVWIDLAAPEKAQWHDVRLSDRNRINKLRRLGLQVDHDPAWRRFDEFVTVYEETMRSLGASGWYFFGRDYFLGLRDALGPVASLFEVTDGDRVLAAGIFTECSGLVQFHLSGTCDEARALSPTRLLLDGVRRWAKERGNVVFHLGGGLGAAADSLFEFKAGLS